MYRSVNNSDSTYYIQELVDSTWVTVYRCPSHINNHDAAISNFKRACSSKYKVFNMEDSDV